MRSLHAEIQGMTRQVQCQTESNTREIQTFGGQVERLDGHVQTALVDLAQRVQAVS